MNLDEVARAVQDGYDVQVLDASTGEDITRLVMTQIITECAKAPDSVFPLDILREMVVASGKATQESALNYMRTVADMYKNALRSVSRAKSPFEMMQNMMIPPASDAPAEPESASGSSEYPSRRNQRPTRNCKVEAVNPGVGGLGVKARKSALSQPKKKVRRRASS